MEYVHKDMLIGEAVEQYPEVIEVFLKYGLQCIGCQISPFETIGMGAAGHGMSEEVIEEMMKEANEIIALSRGEGEKEGARIVTFTKRALEKLEKIRKKYKKEEHALHIGITEGSCPVHSYEMEFKKNQKEDDVVVETQEGLRVVVSKKDERSLRGTVIDYIETQQTSGFVMRNTNAKASCSCGKSFARV